MFKRLSLFTLCVAALLTARLAVMATSSVFDPSEARYATLAANMARSGDYLVPRFIHNGISQSFDGKPALLFQSGALACTLFSESAFATRLPSFLASILLLAILYYAVNKQSNRATARRAITICGTSVAFYSLAGFCMTDMLLALSISGALLLENIFNQSPSRRLSLSIFALLALGMLTKGPIALVLFGLPTFLDACINKRWRILAQHSWFLGPLLFLALSAPWYILMERHSPGFLSYFFIHENFLRFLTHNYGDKYGAGREFFHGMAAIWFIVVTLPWTLSIPFKRLTRRALPAARHSFYFLSLISIIAFWCLTSRVPLAYLLPTVPLFAALLAPHLTPPHFCRASTLACLIAPLALIATLTTTSLTSDKMSGPFFRSLPSTLKPNEIITCPERNYYSPEFYLPSLAPSKSAPPHALLLIRRKHLSDYPTNFIQRAANKYWLLLEPLTNPSKPTQTF